jgi:hypothetical protein
MPPRIEGPALSHQTIPPTRAAAVLRHSMRVSGKVGTNENCIVPGWGELSHGLELKLETGKAITGFQVEGLDHQAP